MKKVAIPEKNGSNRKFLLFFLFAAGILLISVSIIDSINLNTGNSHIVTGTKGLAVTVVPANISVPSSLSGLVNVEVTVQGKTDFSNLSVQFVQSGKLVLQNNFQYAPTTFAVAYIRIPGSFFNAGGVLEVHAQNAGSASVPINWTGSNQWIMLSIALYSGITCVLLAFAFSDIRKISVWALFPAFLLLSVFFGQRYDVYFLISPGFRIISGVDPYRSSASVLPGLTWAYPPLFLIWSYLVDRIYLLLPAVAPVMNSSLNYLGTESGNPYGAWKSLLGLNLPLLYGLVKLPLLLSFYWIFYTLKGLTGKMHWKLWFLNPFIVIVAVIWGQLDVLAAAFMLQAILFNRNGKTWMGVMFAAIGAAIKVFPALIIPYMLLFSKNRIRDLSAILPPLAVILLIYQLTGGIFSSVFDLLYARSLPTYGGLFVTNGLSWQVLLSYFGVTSFPSLFLWVFSPLFIFLTAVSYLRKVPLVDYSVLVFFLFFLTYNFVNPQYLLWIIPLLLVMGREEYALVISAVGAVFMFLTYSFTYFLNPFISWNYQSSALGQIENIKVLVLGSALIRVILAIIATVLFAFMFYKVAEKYLWPKPGISSS